MEEVNVNVRRPCRLGEERWGRRAAAPSPGHPSHRRVRDGPRHGSHPWLIPSLPPRGSRPPRRTLPLAGGLTADLMARLPCAAINLFIGHLPASWRRHQPTLNHTRMADWCVGGLAVNIRGGERTSAAFNKLTDFTCSWLQVGIDWI